MGDECVGQRSGAGRIVVWATAAVLAVGPGATALGADGGPRTQDATPGPPTCQQVLTNDEATAIVGDGYAGPAVMEPRPGFTGCDWQGDDTNFSFTFANTRALADEEHTADWTFDMDLSAVENDTRKREMLPGIGVKAALVDLGDGALLLEVQRADGVARMITYKVDREKAIALARAIAEP